MKERGEGKKEGGKEGVEGREEGRTPLIVVKCHCIPNISL
jgi:hypothetical protein